MVDAVRQRLDMSVKHGASAAPAHLVPGAMDVQIFFGRFFSLGDLRADFLAKDLRAAAGERFQAGFAQGQQSVAHALFCQPAEVQNFNGGEAFELQPGIQRFERAQHIRVVTERKRWMQSADNVQFRDAQFRGLLRFFHDFFDAVLNAVRVALFAGKGAELAAQDAVIGVIDVAIDDVAGAVARLARPDQVGDGAQRVKVLALQEAQGVLVGYALACVDFFVKVAQLVILPEKFHCLN